MIEIKNLSKQFEGFQAVENLSLRIETGEFFALLGPNGAGKTTTISMISTLLLPSGGEIYIDGERLNRALTRERQQEVPRYAEMCRRFLADTEDFSEEHLRAAGIKKRYYNDDQKRCLDEIIEDIRYGKF